MSRGRLLTSAQMLELAAWVKARRALGNNKSKAAELGISSVCMTNYLQRIRRGDFRGKDET